MLSKDSRSFFMPISQAWQLLSVIARFVIQNKTAQLDFYQVGRFLNYPVGLFFSSFEINEKLKSKDLSLEKLLNSFECQF